MQANNPEVSIQGKTIILNVAKKILGMIQFGGAVAMACIFCESFIRQKSMFEVYSR
jgi:hypothetical protein